MKVIAVLWGRCERYSEPQFVAAVSEGLTDAWREEADHLRSLAEEWFRDFDPDSGPWEFWVTYERIECDPLAQLLEARADA